MQKTLGSWWDGARDLGDFTRMTLLGVTGDGMNMGFVYGVLLLKCIHRNIYKEVHSAYIVAVIQQPLQR